MVRRIKVGIIAIVFSFFLAGCAPQIDNGIVVEKHYHPSYSATTPIFTGKVVVPVVRYIPERYEIVIEGKNEKGETVTSTWEVPQEVYGEIALGDYWSNGKENG